MKTAIITGASSFLGMHLCHAFVEEGWRVISGRTRPEKNYAGIEAERLRALAECTTPAEVDITDMRAVAETVQTHAPDLWIHHAGYAKDHAGSDFDLTRGLMVNAGSIPPLFQALKGSGCGVIITGTEAEYPAGDTPRTENMTGTPCSPYGLSKLVETMTAEQYSAITGVAARVARVFLPIGPMDNPNRLFPQVVEALRADRSIELTTCLQRRDIVSVFDICRAYQHLAADLGDGGFRIFNVCSGHAPALQEILKGIAALLDGEENLLKFGERPMRTNEPQTIVGNNKKLAHSFGWVPANLMESGMEAALDLDRTPA